VIPSGGTILEAGDRMMVLADQESIEVVRSIFSSSKPATPVEQNIEDGNHSSRLEEEEDANTS
jgi:hypothetical protein